MRILCNVLRNKSNLTLGVQSIQLTLSFYFFIALLQICILFVSNFNFQCIKKIYFAIFYCISLHISTNYTAYYLHISAFLTAYFNSFYCIKIRSLRYLIVFHFAQLKIATNINLIYHYFVTCSWTGENFFTDWWLRNSVLDPWSICGKFRIYTRYNLKEMIICVKLIRIQNFKGGGENDKIFNHKN